MSGHPLDFVYVQWFNHAIGDRQWEKIQYYRIPPYHSKQIAINIVRIGSEGGYEYVKKNYVPCDPPIRLSEKEVMWLLLKLGV